MLLADALGSIEAGIRPSGGVSETSGTIPSIGGENISPDGRMRYDSVRRIPREFFAAMRRGKLASGDVLINKDGAQTGKVALYAGDFFEAAINEHVFLLRGRPGVLDQQFLFYFLSSEQTQRQISRVITGSAQPGLKSDFAGHVELVLPALEDQRKIADILNTADEAIRQSEQIIAKLEQMSQALLDDLSTLGIDENGKLRDLERHPQQFRDSPLGQIPRSWKMRTLGQLYAEPSRNGLYKQRSFHGRGPLMVQMGDIFRGEEVDFGSASRVQVSSRELETFGLSVGDLLFARRSLVLEGAGKCSIVRRVPEPSTFESSIVRVRVDQTSLLPEFASLFLTSRSSYLVRRRFIRQVAVSGVSGADIAQFPVAVPHIEEQVQIIEAHKRARQRIREERNQSAKLLLIKRGLLHDLLTGRAPISPTSWRK